ncbi:MAG: hypothetical protein U9P14_08900, partial [Gemmatimonadota bacterium]|nr:hypothetical protein [Gemmatimonadota bacterium]
MKKNDELMIEDNGSTAESLKSEKNRLLNRCQNLELKYNISRLLGDELEYSKLLDLILDKIMETLQAERGVIVTGGPEDFEVKVARNLDGEEL